MDLSFLYSLGHITVIVVLIGMSLVSIYLLFRAIPNSRRIPFLRHKSNLSKFPITLATLNKATAQEVFDQVAIHLLTQKERSSKYVGNSFTCCYRSGDLKCAAGCLISDKEYDPIFENNRWKSLVYKWPDFPSAHVELIEDLQMVHDLHEVCYWKGQLELVAKRHSLNTKAIDSFKPKNQDNDDI